MTSQKCQLLQERFISKWLSSQQCSNSIYNKGIEQMKKLLITGANGYVGSDFLNQYKNKYLFEKFSLLNQKLEDINFNSIDVVLHCAALVHQKIEHPYEKYHEINVDYPVKLAKLAKKNGVKQFVLLLFMLKIKKNQKIILNMKK